MFSKTHHPRRKYSQRAGNFPSAQETPIFCALGAPVRTPGLGLMSLFQNFATDAATKERALSEVF